jgi:hypothetical protein
MPNYAIHLGAADGLGRIAASQASLVSATGLTLRFRVKGASLVPGASTTRALLDISDAAANGLGAGAKFIFALQRDAGNNITPTLFIGGTGLQGFDPYLVSAIVDLTAWYDVLCTYNSTGTTDRRQFIIWKTGVTIPVVEYHLGFAAVAISTNAGEGILSIGKTLTAAYSALDTDWDYLAIYNGSPYTGIGATPAPLPEPTSGDSGILDYWMFNENAGASSANVIGGGPALALTNATWESGYSTAATVEIELYPFVDFKAIVGEPLYCLAEALDITGAVSGDAVSFASSSPAVATINSSTGLFTPLTNGTTTITATAGSVSVSRIMTVVTPVAGVPIGSAVTRAMARAHIDALSSPGLVKSVDLNYAGNLQNAMNAAVADGTGLTLLITPGVNYGEVSPPSNQGALITIMSSGLIPPRGIRMTKTRTATYNLPRIWTSTTQSAVSFSNAIRNKGWRFIGVDIGYPVSGTQKLSNYGAFYLPIDVTRLSRIPKEIHLDRCYLRGSPNAYNSRFGLSADGIWVTAIDCGSEDHHYDANVPGAYGTDANYDSQGLRVVYGPGPVYAENCGWQSSHECVAYGGGAANIANMVGRDFRLYHCYLNRPLAFKGVYTAKNLWESKQGLFLENEDCVYANIWVDNQNGYCIMLTPTNSGGPDTMRTRDVWIHGAVMETVGGIATLIDQSGLARVTFENILVRGLDADPETGSPGGNLHVGVAFKILLTAVSIPGITLRHITAFNRANNFIEAPNELAGVTYPNFVVEDNNIGEGTNGYGLIRSTSAVEKALWDAIKGAGSRWRNNAGADVFSGTRSPPGNGTTDTNNTYFIAPSAQQLVNPAKATDRTATFAELAVPLSSPLLGTARGGSYVTTDGKDPGADIAAITAWYDNVVSGTFAASGAADHLTLDVQPAGTVSGVPLAQQPVVTLRDVNGLVYTSYTGRIRAFLASGNMQVHNNVVFAVAGVGTFTTLSGDGSGTQILGFEALDMPAIPGVTSTPFTFPPLPGRSHFTRRSRSPRNSR